MGRIVVYVATTIVGVLYSLTSAAAVKQLHPTKINNKNKGLSLRGCPESHVK
jgi:hypothetical protein